MILIISWSGDEHAQAVSRELERSGAAAQVVDLALFPRDLTLSMRYGVKNGLDFRLRLANGVELPMRDVRAIWWRRPRHFGLHPEVTRGSHQTFAYNEAQEAFSGLWQALDTYWINSPLADQAAARKTYQLRIASDVGLRIPDTLVTNEPERAREFIDTLGVGEVIYKAFSATETEWRETRLIRSEELALLAHVRYAPVIFQEYIRAVADLRITVVGAELFAAAIYSQETAYPVDFRMDMHRARTEPVTLPSEVRERLTAFMNRLGLVYGAVDMRLTEDGEYVFLEVNPAGQWLFVEQRTGQPITQAVARALVEARSS